MKSAKLLITLVITLSASSMFAADPEPEEIYLRAFTLIQKADVLAERESVADAIKTYEEADTALISILKLYPAFNPKLVAYREHGVTKVVENLKLPFEQREKFVPVASKQGGKA